ncbi:response regulator transcription factor [Actinoplanes sp. NPDC049599]|uniref:response regulator transcription factor n=1 Tax=Actinoplanes sp. NPDC049599 TaxID=3363903 RepID=UPI0037B07BDA
MMDSYRRALDGATALLERVGAGAPWAAVCAVVAERLGCTASVYVEGVAGSGPSVWMPEGHEALPEGRVAGDSREWRGSSCARGTGHHLALPVSATSVLVVCRAHRRFDAGDREVAQCLLPLLHSVQRHVDHPDRPRLTPRELAVLRATADGLTASAAGRRLQISARTFEKHLERLYRKLGTRDRVHTVLLAQELGVLPVSAARSAGARPSGGGAAT